MEQTEKNKMRMEYENGEPIIRMTNNEGVCLKMTFRKAEPEKPAKEIIMSILTAQYTDTFLQTRESV